MFADFTDQLPYQEHPLDRPVWNALVSRQQRFATGSANVRCFDTACGWFAAMADYSGPCQAAMATLLSARGTIALLEAEPPPRIANAQTEVHLLWQMTIDRLTYALPATCAVVSLSEADVPDMLRLTAVTKPGPFFANTNRLGEFVGVRHDGELVAMAGERMKPHGFTEVSGVCTAPGHRGRGYAGALVGAVAERILFRGETPFLHAYASNTAAISLYRTLGFTLRRKMHLHMLTGFRTEVSPVSASRETPAPAH